MSWLWLQSWKPQALRRQSARDASSPRQSKLSSWIGGAEEACRGGKAGAAAAAGQAGL